VPRPRLARVGLGVRPTREAKNENPTRRRWGDGLTEEDMEKCVWVRPELVAQIEFLEWTESDHLRHAKFTGLREDKNARNVIKEREAKPD
jgi:ATP-dependent DNA ligase